MDRVIVGYHPVRVLLEQLVTVKRINVKDALLYLQRGKKGRRSEEIVQLAKKAKVVVKTVDRKFLDNIAVGTVHNGFALVVSEISYTIFDTRYCLDLGVALEGIQDPRNLGALFRVCDATGVGFVLIRDRQTADHTLPSVAKTSAGAVYNLNISRCNLLHVELEELKAQGYRIVGSTLDGSPPWELDLKGKVVICFGGEEKGLKRVTRAVCDCFVTLPMRGKIESLNVATAASAILYESLRQRVN